MPSLVVQLMETADMLLEYEHKEGFLYRLNPVTKLLMFVVVIAVGALLSNPLSDWIWVLVLWLGLAAIATTSGVPLIEEFRKRWYYIAPIVGTMLFFNILMGRGGGYGDIELAKEAGYNILLTIPPWFVITTENINFGLGKTLYYLATLTAAVMILKTTRMSDFNFALHKQFRLPYAFSMIVTTTLRSLPMVTDGFIMTYNAQMARGFNPGRGNLIVRIQKMSAIFKPLFLALLKTIYQMNIVFQSRGLDIETHERTRLRDVPYTTIDFLTMAFFLALAALVFGLWYFGYIQFTMG